MIWTILSKVPSDVSRIVHREALFQVLDFECAINMITMYLNALTPKIAAIIEGVSHLISALWIGCMASNELRVLTHVRKFFIRHGKTWDVFTPLRLH